MSSIKAAVYESELFGAAAPDVTLSRVAGNLVITPKNNAAPLPIGGLHEPPTVTQGTYLPIGTGFHNL